METALDIQGLHVRYGPIRAVQGVDLSVPNGGITALLGANGAGKTTTVMAVAGTLPVASGTVSIFGTDMTEATPDAIVRAGVAISPEGRRVFAQLSVEENLVLAGSVLRDDALSARRVADMKERFPILGERSRQMAGLLSGGEQQMLAVARALMSGPRLLLLDEPSLGLAPQVVDQIFDIVEELKADGISVLLVEQNAALALDIADHAVVLANGTVAAAGAPSDLANDAVLRSAYLAA
ncbi:ABC transporter ATP-binding protein [Rhodophyticola sp. CCM32]|uniref:ABC transporter ATP-binding protein n=1 Tax=Rhodophyticola sp. CCM32 TaxID=2916397 RepID=UPI00107F5248|nr:ABC transporter ATP-binding protein [Rhodophyticola sp. CCM32]QBX99904.1 ABC transporter ATP-binding protein [Rhodophyticola sp. CCM32]